MPPKPSYEEVIDKITAQRGRDLKIRKEQLKNTWLSKNKKIEAAGILCAARHWKNSENKTVLPSYFSLGTEGRRNFGSQEPTVTSYQITPRNVGCS